MLRIICIFYISILPLSINALSQNNDSLSYFILKGNETYKNFNNDSSLFFYSKALNVDSNNYEAAWKISRAYVDIGETIKDDEKQKQFYLKGKESAGLAIRLDSTGAKGYLSAAIAIGRVALDAGKKEQVRLSKEVKRMVDKSLELNPNDDIAWHVLGRWNRKMATLGWVQKRFADIFLGGIPKDASVENAKNCFIKAIELNPSNVRHHLELGITYEKLDEKILAIEEYKKVLSLPISDADDQELKEDAQRRLKDFNKDIY
jgi:tetratricopeptide (TPR) repeat protein